MIYEINFLVLQSKTAKLEKIREEAKKFIESFEAKVVEEKEYLKRKLAYEIQHENYGFFTVLRFEFKEAKNLDELKIKLNQKTDVARYIIVQAEGLPSLKEQDAKELEKPQGDKKSIKSEDVEKVLTEQKKAKATKKEIEIEKKEKPVVAKKKEIKENKEEEIVVEKENIIVEEEKEIVEETLSTEEMKPEKKATVKKEKVVAEKKEKKEEVEEPRKDDKKNKEKEAEEEVSLDELDKKLDEILNS